MTATSTGIFGNFNLNVLPPKNGMSLSAIEKANSSLSKLLIPVWATSLSSKQRLIFVSIDRLSMVITRIKQPEPLEKSSTEAVVVNEKLSNINAEIERLEQELYKENSLIEGSNKLLKDVLKLQRLNIQNGDLINVYGFCFEYFSD